MTASRFTGAEKYALIDRPSELIKLHMKPGGHPLYMWRDDPSAFAFGGNKVRFYEYLIPEILKEAPDVIVTSGSLHSNHIRVTAEVAAKLRISAVLLITDDRPDGAFFQRTNNVTVAEALGAKTEFIGSFAAMLKIGEYVGRLKNSGLKVFSVPNAGHTPQAVNAFADVITEALSSLDAQGSSPARIFLPCASGTTLSGTLFGLRAAAEAGRSVPGVTAVAVGNTPGGCSKGVTRLLRAASRIYNGCNFVSEANVIDCGKNDYGHPDEELLAFRNSVMENEGVIIDRTYNLPAFYGTVKALEAEPGDSPELYINTGGFTG
ncbi:MAG: pyridoxal-phosphate dependent enzyme [Clostridia bacterium]|nr:pyridoxal-phosphate dependent enzyme [Clostridia bacterium]